MDSISPRLVSKLRELDIDLIFTKMQRRGFYWPKERAIVINETILEANDVNFEIAHELAHALEKHDTYGVLYKRSFVWNSKIESEANLLAVKMLIDVYLEENDMEFEQLNSTKFMEYYGIRSCLFEEVDKTLRSNFSH